MKSPELAVLSILFFVCCLMTSCTQQEINESHVQRNDSGVAMMGQFEYKEAHQIFSQLVSELPRWTVAKVNLAIATLNRQEDGDIDDALAILQDALQDEPNNLRALYTSGIIEFYLGNTNNALKYFEKVVEQDASDAYVLYFLGQSYLQLGDYEKAQELLLATIELDNYLRSSYWAAALASRRLGQHARADELVADYRRLEANPVSRTADISYKEMGPKAEVVSIAHRTPPPAARGEGALFSEKIEILNESNGLTNVSVVVLGDTMDLFLVQTDTLTWLTFNESSRITTTQSSIEIVGIDSVLLGDLDNDAIEDVITCGKQGIAWVHFLQSNELELVRQPTTTACTSAALVDADHDGDLDVLFVGEQGTFQLTNLRDEEQRFEELQITPSTDNPPTKILVSDLDSDRDLDIIVLSKDSIEHALRNDRTWRYTSFKGIPNIESEKINAAVVGDIDSNGYPDVLIAMESGIIHRLSFDGVGWQREELTLDLEIATDHSILALSLADIVGDGRLELILTLQDAISILNIESSKELSRISIDGGESAIPVLSRPSMGPGLLVETNRALEFLPPGEGRYEFLAIDPVGMRDAVQMRSNASGIGTRLKLRIGGDWSIQDRLSNHSGNGQNLMPMSFGMRGYDEANNVVLEWSDGVFQTELDLNAGELHRIEETERQIASCPVVFAWNGETYEFVSDVLGVAGLGFFASPGETFPSRSFERFRIDEHQLASKNGNYVVKIGEPMEESLYLDAVKIGVVDIPTGWQIVLDERMGTAEPDVSGRVISYRSVTIPDLALDADGNNITASLALVDRKTPDPGAFDTRFIGRLQNDQIITLRFNEPLPRDSQVLVADGWIEYPYSQTMFSSWQAQADYRSSTIEVQNSDGTWSVLLEEVGYPAGMPREMAVPLPRLPENVRAIRIRSNLEIYWDRIRLVTEESHPDVKVRFLDPVIAEARRTGFAYRTTGQFRLPHYDYNKRLTYWDAKYPEGFYSSYGDVLELVSHADSAIAIIGSGEEIHLEFPVVEYDSNEYTRNYVLEFRGWARDMDLYTEHGETVEPLPVLSELTQEQLDRVDRLHRKYNIRFQDGL